MNTATGSDELTIEDISLEDLTAAAEVGGEFIPSEQQAAIFDCLLNRRSHIQGIARAGTGKTTTSLQGLVNLARQVGRNLKVVVVQFNKSIQIEAQGKLSAMGLDDFATALTCHSVGNSALFRAFGKLPLEEYKTERMLPDGLDREVKNCVSKLVSICMSMLIDESEAMPGLLDDLASEYNIDVNGNAPEIYPLVPEILRRRKKEISCIDFDDMLWLPVVLNLPVRQADLLIVDESQDLSPVQHAMVQKMIGSTGRMMFIGDPRQAIYAFRGADHTSMDTLASALQETQRGLETFPLTVTRRCPKKVVQLAQQLVPDFVAHESAPEGIVRIAKATEQPEKGDLVLCRVNAPLVSMAYELIRANVPAIIQGRDIGRGLTTLTNKLAKPFDSVNRLMDKLNAYESREAERISATAKNVERKLQALQDKCDCLHAVSEGCDTVKEVLDRISSLFANIDAGADHSRFVLLSTVHKAKGMESPVVRILNPEMMPHPMAKGKSRGQEENILYVAVTRAMNELVFYTALPRILDGRGILPDPEVEEPVVAEEVA